MKANRHMYVSSEIYNSDRVPILANDHPQLFAFSFECSSPQGIHIKFVGGHICKSGQQPCVERNGCRTAIYEFGNLIIRHPGTTRGDQAVLLLNTPIISVGDILSIAYQGFRTLFRIAVANRVKQGAHMWINAFKELCFLLTNHSPGLVCSELRPGHILQNSWEQGNLGGREKRSQRVHYFVKRS